MNDGFQKAGAPLLDLMKAIQERAERARRTEPPPVPVAACRRCGGKGYFLRAEGPLAVARRCSCELWCADCHGRGYRVVTRDGYEFHEPCECTSLDRRIGLYNEAQLPAAFLGKGFDDFYYLAGDPPALLKAKNILQEFANTAVPGETMGKCLIGGPGRGKTHLLAATLAHLTLARGIRCRYVEISFLFADLKAAISDPKARATVDKIDALAEVPVLAVDELGKGRGSVFEEEVLDELIGRRYNTGKLTLFATNYPRVDREPSRRADPTRADPFAQSLRTRVGERVFSRLHKMVDFVELPETVRDRRLDLSGGAAAPPRRG
jgi:DNA replication protein DnaC